MVQVGKKLPFPDGAVDLASVGITADADIQGAQARLSWVFDLGREQDCARAGAEGWFRLHELLKLFESLLPQKFEESARLAARDNEALDLIELIGLFDEHDFGTQLFEPSAVRVEIALQGQHSDFHTFEDLTTEATGNTGESKSLS